MSLVRARALFGTEPNNPMSSGRKNRLLKLFTNNNRKNNILFFYDIDCRKQNFFVTKSKFKRFIDVEFVSTEKGEKMLCGGAKYINGNCPL